MPTPRPCRPLLATVLLALCACGSMAPPTSQARDASASGTRSVGDAQDAAAPESTSPASGEPATQTQILSLRPGGQVALGGGNLRYLRLVNDSRCAPDVQCVWAGDAEIALAWTPDGGTARSFSLHTGVEPRQQPLGDGRNLRLVELARGPAPTARLELRAAP